MLYSEDSRTRKTRELGRLDEYLEDSRTWKTQGLGRLKDLEDSELLGTLGPSKPTTVEVMDY